AVDLDDGRQSGLAVRAPGRPVPRHGEPVVSAGDALDRGVRLEQPVPAQGQGLIKAGAADSDGVAELAARVCDVLDDVGEARGGEEAAGLPDEAFVPVLPAELLVDLAEVEVSLAGWAGVDGVKVAPVLGDVVEGVALVELEGVVGLGVDVDADDVEAGPVVAHRGAASTAEQVEEDRTAVHRGLRNARATCFTATYTCTTLTPTARNRTTNQSGRYTGRGARRLTGPPPPSGLAAAPHSRPPHTAWSPSTRPPQPAGGTRPP